MPEDRDESTKTVAAGKLESCQEEVAVANEHSSFASVEILNGSLQILD